MSTVLRSLLILSLAVCLCRGAERDSEPRADLDVVTVYLVLSGECSAETVLRHKSAPNRTAREAVMQCETDNRTRQDELERTLTGMGIRTSGRFRKLANALRVHVPRNRLTELQKLPGVAHVSLVPEYVRQTSTSVPFIGAPAVWSGLLSSNATGEGVRIGIIDTGIDYHHAHFGGSGVPQHYTNNNSTLIEPGTFPTAKVVGGYDLAGDSYTGNTGTRAPDPDPLDCAANGHGTHVAGIAAGFGVLANGLTYSGAYTQGMNAAQFFIGPGVAPQARLYAIKIFGCSGSTQLVMDGLEWAADPNDDGDFNDRLDVVNLSVGGAFGFTGAGDPDQDAINRLVDLGCIVVAGAGNNGNVLYNVFSPGVAEKCISVGNSIDAGFNPAVEVLSPGSIAGPYEAVEGRFTAPLASTGPREGRLVYADPPLVCGPIVNATDLAGNIALIDRGTCTFVDKIRRVQAAGAVAVIVANNVSTPPVGMTGFAQDIVIPGFMISQSDGIILKSALASNVTVRLDPNYVFPRSLADQLDLTSSRGPASPGNVLKPEIVAPGNNITSAQCGSGTNSLTQGGTSMSTPHVTGAAALLRQLRPGWPVKDIKAVLMNTAKATHASGIPFPESWTGAGRVQVDQASRAEVTVEAENSGGLIALSFGSLVLTNTYREICHVELTNHGVTPVTYSIQVSNTVSEPGFSLTPLNNSVVVPAFGSIRVGMELVAEPSLFDRTPDAVSAPLINGLPRNVLHEASGQIWFHNTNLSIHLPFYCNLRAGSSLHAAGPHVGVAATGRVAEVSIPLSGDSAHPAALVSAFELGLTSSDRQYTDPWRAAADLLAIGAATDAPSLETMESSTVFFGIATAGNWTTPQSFVAQYDVLIDSNRDGTDDYRLFNSSAGSGTIPFANANTANDAFLSSVEDLSLPAPRIVTNTFLNAFPPNVADTAVFNNSVMVLAVRADQIGLSAANSRFNYRVRTQTPKERGPFIVETTPYVTFDALRPILDTTSHGIASTPFHPVGDLLSIRVDRNQATNGPSPSLLLLHHFNVAGQRIDVVKLELAEIRITSVWVDGGNLRFSFPTVSGRSYVVERTDNLSGGSWTSIATLAGTGGVLNTIDPGALEFPNRFYRVRLLP